ncbi:hypothetical protein B0T25DRAFT_294159 [Lasiosphaeria hispida]|uniref:Uncharacterized protein n=1 Tax=Lasiosphaeria hispida TaxID=260671 RepID=A0AAJ0HCN1_9PEZI|nr:hypothetical protein B0T25DRAFT_294159 [Lasiosphaeria hispida]
MDTTQTTLGERERVAGGVDNQNGRIAYRGPYGAEGSWHSGALPAKWLCTRLATRATKVDGAKLASSPLRGAFTGYWFRHLQSSQIALTLPLIVVSTSAPFPFPRSLSAAVTIPVASQLVVFSGPAPSRRYQSPRRRSPAPQWHAHRLLCAYPTAIHLPPVRHSTILKPTFFMYMLCHCRLLKYQMHWQPGLAVSYGSPSLSERLPTFVLRYETATRHIITAVVHPCKGRFLIVAVLSRAWLVPPRLQDLLRPGVERPHPLHSQCRIQFFIVGIQHLWINWVNLHQFVVLVPSGSLLPGAGKVCWERMSRVTWSHYQ